MATRVFGIGDESILAGLTLVGGGFISLVGYQARGYDPVPVFRPEGKSTGFVS